MAVKCLNSIDLQMTIRGSPKIRGNFLGVPIIRTIVFWGLYWGPPILGKYHKVRGVQVKCFSTGLGCKHSVRDVARHL